jgi:hypothetical protein
MTPKEKAKELINKYLKCKDVSNYYYVIPIQDDAKQCALIAVDEIIKALRKDLAIFELGKGFWQEVKQEIEKL